MDFLLDNPLATLDGPSFLVLYALFTLFTLVATAIARHNIDDTNKLPAPAIPPQVDPYEIAYLRGGANELARSAVFALVKKGFAGIARDGKIFRMGETPAPNTLSELERRSFGWLGTGKEAKDVFATGTGLAERLSGFGENYDHGLETRSFIPTDEMKAKARRNANLAAATLFAVGGYKVSVALLNGRTNVIFLIIATLFASLIALSMRNMPRLTKLGKMYVARLQAAFEDLKLRSHLPDIASAAPQAGTAAVDPLLLSVGVFGTGILAGTAFANYNDTFARSQQSSSGGGCGSSCGSGCGSGCGGGCGGCS